MAEIIYGITYSIICDICELLPTILFIAVIGIFAWTFVEAEDEINKKKKVKEMEKKKYGMRKYNNL